MKKLLIGMLTLLITASFYHGYKNVHSEKKPPTPEKKTLNGFDQQRALDMISNFKNRYANDNGRKSISAWYSKADIQNMLDLLTTEGNDPAIRTDGVRFYFGSETPTGTTKLDVKILLVSTKPKAPVLPDHASAHGDYYDHTSVYLNSTNITGDAINDNAARILREGGLLYAVNSPALNVTCPNPNPHLILNADAYNWVQRRHDKDDHGVPPLREKSAYNTESEWFDICFITSLFTAVVNPANNLDGIRIYLANGREEPATVKRDVFILVPTRTNGVVHQDAYDCLNLVRTSICDLPGNAPAQGTHIPGGPRVGVRTFRSMDGGYDIGQLCPYNCN
jgi:hypothetical protein